MKKSIQLIAITAFLTLACTPQNHAEMNTPTLSNPVQVSTTPICFSAEGLTKAVSEVDINSLKATGFQVCGATSAQSDQNAFASSLVYFNLSALYNNDKQAFFPSSTYYFPQSDNLIVFAANKPISFKEGGFAQECGFSVSNPWQEDIIASSATWNPSQDNRKSAINLAFQHILSQMTFKAKGAAEGLTFNIKSINVDTKSSGKYYFVKKDGENYTSNTWVLADDTTREHFSSVTPTNHTSASFTPAGEAFAYFPGTWTVTVNYDVFSGSIQTGSYSKSFQAALTAGKHHIFNLTLPFVDSDAIYFSVSIEDWQTSEEDVIL
jgi:hypothetical protein